MNQALLKIDLDEWPLILNCVFAWVYWTKPIHLLNNEVTTWPESMGLVMKSHDSSMNTS